MSRLALFLLGPPRIELNGEELHIPRRKAVALLAYLAVEPSRHSRDALATLFWPDYDQSGARGRLRRTLSTLNRTLGEGWLAVDRETVGINPDAGLWLDTDHFRQQLAACETHGHPTDESCPDCLARLTEAAELYRDDFMSGFTLPDSLEFDGWQRYQADRLRDELAGVLERLSACHAAQGEFDSAIATAGRWLELDPLRERAHRQLMELYARAGQRTAALRQYRACLRVLEGELGVLPSAETTALYEGIRAGTVGLRPGTLPSATPLIPNNLPPQSTRFIGREKELAELDELIASPDTRLVSILGPGGIGKTRLALALMERQLDAGSDGEAESVFQDGVFFVSLAGLSGHDQIGPSVADALGFRIRGGEGESRTSEQQVLDFLREKRLLLVLDNFEHLLEGVDLVTDILRTAPEVQVLVTSRERLHLHEECACAIRGLDYPVDAQPIDRADYAAAQLFVDTARRIQTGFELTGDDVASLAQLCRSLEGLPLGIELAAGWLDVLSLSDIAEEIERSLDILETEWRDVPRRHRSMRAVFETTWRRLSEAEREIFAQLSVFRGGFTRAAARDVAGADLKALAGLVGKSMLQFDRAQERYTIHELLRQYGADKLGRDPAREAAAQDRHSAFYCAALGRWGDHLNRGDDPGEGIDFETDWANVREAWDVAARQGLVARLDRALDGLWHFVWPGRYHKESDAMYQLACDGLRAGSEPLRAERQRVLAKALLYRSHLNAEWGKWELAAPAIQQSKALLEDLTKTGCDACYERAWLELMMGLQSHPDPAQARRHFEQAVTLQRESGCEGQVAYRLVDIFWPLVRLGEYNRAKKCLDESLMLFRRLGNQSGVSTSLLALGDLGRSTGDRREAQRRYQEALALARAQGDRSATAIALERLGWLAGFLGDFQAEAEFMRETAALYREVGSRERHSYAVGQLSQAHWFCGEFDRAYALIEESMAIADEIGAPLLLLWLFGYRAWLNVAAGNYDAARTYALRGRALQQSSGARHPGGLALSQCLLGWVATAEGDYQTAIQPLQQSIIAFQGGNRPDTAQEFTAWALAALGRAEYGMGNRARAQQHLLEALEFVVEIRAFIPLLHLMPIIPVVLAEEEDLSLKERAVELYALATSHPFVAKAQLFEDIAWRKVRAATETLPPDVIAAAQERGRALDWRETAEALLNELGW